LALVGGATGWLVIHQEIEWENLLDEPTLRHNQGSYQGSFLDFTSDASSELVNNYDWKRFRS
jgi:hypothetical protein